MDGRDRPIVVGRLTLLCYWKDQEFKGFAVSFDRWPPPRSKAGGPTYTRFSGTLQQQIKRFFHLIFSLCRGQVEADPQRLRPDLAIGP